jgi:ankyrin repeat protein
MDVRIKITEASASGHTDAVARLIAIDADIHADDEYDEGRFRCAPLRAAATAGHTATVNLLLNFGAEVHAPGREGPDAALRNAAYRGHIDTVKVLLANHAKLYTGDENSTGYGLCAAAANAILNNKGRPVEHFMLD